MRIEINNSKTLTILEQNLIVKNHRLYNTVTNEYEALDGDKIQFCVISANGSKVWIGGTVEGYTCNRRIKLKGVNELYAAAQGVGKVIERCSTITDTDYIGEEEIKKMEEEDWEAILSA